MFRKETKGHLNRAHIKSFLNISVISLLTGNEFWVFFSQILLYSQNMAVATATISTECECFQIHDFRSVFPIIALIKAIIWTGETVRIGCSVSYLAQSPRSATGSRQEERCLPPRWGHEAQMGKRGMMDAWKPTPAWVSLGLKRDTYFSNSLIIILLLELPFYSLTHNALETITSRPTYTQKTRLSLCSINSETKGKHIGNDQDPSRLEERRKWPQIARFE